MVAALLQRGYNVTVLNRGQTPDDLPAEVERLRADRTDRMQLKAALGSREFDLVIDTTLYTGDEANAAVEIFSGRTGRYIFLSTGQVYLVRVGAKRPFREEDYSGPVMPAPPQAEVSDYQNWLYGFDKRAAEDVFARAWRERKFPVTSLRLPIVNSERDHYDRIYGYFLRLLDGGPLVIPEGDGLPVRHVYGGDVVNAILKLAESTAGQGEAYNIGQDETLSLQQFLELLAQSMGRTLKLVRAPWEKLEREGLLPNCSPFSGRWMSSLDNARSKGALGITYTPMSLYLPRLVHHYASSPARQIDGYMQRAQELQFAQSY
jgi:nucleoside-diphosphate-sugar epimerase